MVLKKKKNIKNRGGKRNSRTHRKQTTVKESPRLNSSPNGKWQSHHSQRQIQRKPTNIFPKSNPYLPFSLAHLFQRLRPLVQTFTKPLICAWQWANVASLSICFLPGGGRAMPRQNCLRTTRKDKTRQQHKRRERIKVERE